MAHMLNWAFWLLRAIRPTSLRSGPLQCCHQATDSAELRNNLMIMKLTSTGSHMS